MRLKQLNRERRVFKVRQNRRKMLWEVYESRNNRVLCTCKTLHVADKVRDGMNRSERLIAKHPRG